MLRKLFDEKLISIINNFLDNPTEKFSLTQAASLANMSVSTTSRILNKLVGQDIIEIVPVGKSKYYKLKRSEKTASLSKILRKEDHIQEFVDRLKKDPRVKAIILEEKKQKSAKLLIVGDFLSKEKIKILAEEIGKKHGFKIQFIEIGEKKFKEMTEIGLYDLDKKIIWKKTSLS